MTPNNFQVPPSTGLSVVAFPGAVTLEAVCTTRRLVSRAIGAHPQLAARRRQADNEVSEPAELCSIGAGYGYNPERPPLTSLDLSPCCCSVTFSHSLWDSAQEKPLTSTKVGQNLFCGTPPKCSLASQPPTRQLTHKRSPLQPLPEPLPWPPNPWALRCRDIRSGKHP